MDETQPLLAEPRRSGAAEAAQETNVHLVTFDPKGDPENPVDWPAAYKWSVIALLTFTAFTVTFTCIAVVPIANRIVTDLDDGRPNKSATVLLVTIWELGEAAGPLLIAPLSEIYGRYPVMNVCNVGFVAATLLALVSRSSAMFIAARALTGLAVASNVLGPAIVGDMFAAEQRGGAMSLISLAPLVGGAVGPLMSVAVAESLGWHAVLRMSLALASAVGVLFLLYFRETYGVHILRRRAARLRLQTGNPHLRTAFDSDAPRLVQLRDAVLRPLIVLSGSSVLQVMSLFGSVVFTYFYIFSTTLPDIAEGVYGIAPTETGLVFITFSIGSAMSVIFCNFALDKIYVRLRDAHKGFAQPEFRLPLVLFGAFALPFAVALYGWAAALRLPLGVFVGTIIFMGTSLMLAFLPIMAYVVDAFGVYSASALTAVIVTRCLMGTFLPLTTTPLVEKLGYGWGFTVLAALGLCVAPIPVIVYRYGLKWRQTSPYTRDQ
ncbi:major facilitator superfamily transporter [Xylariales sp. PMI_506]|nr:major facilitator superfamily transporter [Xylariales sp. PMI_506]